VRIERRVTVSALFELHHLLIERGLGEAVRENISDMNLNLSEEQAALLARELTTIIDNDRFSLSPRIQMLCEIRNMIGPKRPQSTAVTDQALRATAGRTKTSTVKGYVGPLITLRNAATGWHAWAEAWFLECRRNA